MTVPVQVCLPVVGCVGILGNLGAILILLRPEMKSTFHHTLITLAVVDLLFIITLIIDTKRFDLDLKNQVWVILSLIFHAGVLVDFPLLLEPIQEHPDDV